MQTALRLLPLMIDSMPYFMACIPEQQTPAVEMISIAGPPRQPWTMDAWEGRS